MPSPALVSCEGLAKSFGGPPLFEGLTFAVHEGDHIGLVGPNGSGKSTLLRILGGMESPDAGTRTHRKNIHIGYVPQTPVFPPGSTAGAVVLAAVARDARLDDQERTRCVTLALGKTGFTDPMVPTDTLSGGWRARLAIARAIALSPDLLLLDEPTNHLDIESILWLESMLRSEAGAFVAVSHDRYFLEKVARRMLEINPIHAAGLFQTAGGYTDFLEARDAALANQEAYRETLAGLVRREVAWLRRGAKARTTKSKARIQSAEAAIEKLDEARARGAARSLDLELASSGRRTKRLWSGEGIRIAFDGRVLVDRLDLLLTPGMRCGVIGPNGSGKTSLLRTIAGEIAPAAGTIRRAEDLRVVHFAQNRDVLDPSLTLKRALAHEGDSVIHGDRAIHVASWAKRFLFSTGQLETPVSRLSGGERARIVLARMMLQAADLLVLDEPTNDLDIPALEVLEEALLDFPGALVIVSHDRHLLDRVSTQVLALDGRGGAQAFADYDQWETNRPAATPTVRKTSRPDAGPRRRTGPRRLGYLEQREYDGMEAAVLEAESRVEEARARAEDPAIASDAAALQQRLAELSGLEAEVDRLYARWADLEGKMNEQS